MTAQQVEIMERYNFSTNKIEQFSKIIDKIPVKSPPKNIEIVTGIEMYKVLGCSKELIEKTFPDSVHK